MSVSTVADLLEQLGDIPPERVRLNPTPGTATERDLLRVLDHEDRTCELVDGVLVEKAMGFLESTLAVLLTHFLWEFLEEHDLGVVAGADGALKLRGGLVRAPDVSFISWDRLPGRRVPSKPIPDLAPDLAVEVLSKGNTKKEMKRKLREYFAAGTRLVWLADPKARIVRVHTDPDQSVLLGEDDVLDGGEVLPGFTLSLRDWFDRANRRGPGDR